MQTELLAVTVALVVWAAQPRRAMVVVVLVVWVALAARVDPVPTVLLDVLRESVQLQVVVAVTVPMVVPAVTVAMVVQAVHQVAA